MYNMSKEIKKLTFQYAYISLEKEEVDEICTSVEGEIRAYIEKNYPDQFNRMFDEKNQKEIKEENSFSEPEEEYEIPQKEIKNKGLKKVYRKIAAKIHPDKAEGDSDLFSEAAKAYEKDNMIKLIEIAASINIEITTLMPETIELIKINIKDLSDHTNKQKSTIAWAWYNGNEEERKMLIENLFNTGDPNDKT